MLCGARGNGMGLQGVTALGLTGVIVLSPDARMSGSIAAIAILLLTIVLVDRTSPSLGATLLAVAFGVAPAAMMTGAIHDILPSTPPVVASRLSIAVLWFYSSRTLGRILASRVRDTEGIRVFAVRTTAVAMATGWYLAGLARQFLPGADLVTRLSFAILEEDNAHVIGVMREVATLGPRGGELADMYGTGFVVLPHLLIRILGGPIASEAADPRQAAVTAFTTSSLLVVLLLGLSLWTLGTTTWTDPLTQRRRGIATDVGAFGTAFLSAWIALAVIIVIPMRTSFLTFVWGVMLLVLATTLALTLPPSPRINEIGSVIVHVLAACWLLFGSWPFVIAGLVPIAIWFSVLARKRFVFPSSERVRLGLTGTSLVLAVALASRWSSSGLLAEVLSYGREALTIRASAIEADGAAWMALLILASTVLAGSVIRSGSRLRVLSSERARHSVLALTPIVGLFFMYFVLRVAALILTGGELNYAGSKLLYGILSAGLLLAAPVATRVTSSWSLPYQSLLIGSLAVIILTSSTIRPAETWWDRSRPQRLPQSELVAETLRGSTPGAPIRCLPPPDMEADRIARRAAYECVRFVEDAFNEDRRHGHRISFLHLEDEDFRRAVAVALRDLEGSPNFTPLTMRGGWAGLPPERVSGLSSPWDDE
jgi:hypothetical protein